MPYDVSGFVEVRYDPDCDLLEWQPLLCLNAVFLGGDEVSAKLFGLAKHPPQPGLFEKRGVPSDASKAVRAWDKENNAFIEQHGEGDFNHTYALWSEISAVDLSDIDLEGSQWKLVFDFLPKLLGPYEARGIRIVVAGNW